METQTVSAVEGVIVRGTFRGEGTSPDGKYPHLKVTTADYEQRLEYEAFNPRTGERTPVGDALADLVVGEKVEVLVFVSAVPYGRGKAFAKLAARSIRKL